MIKILLILGILLTFVNDVSSSDEFHPIPTGSDTIISSSNQKKSEVPGASNLIFSEDEVILTESGFNIVPGYIPDWFWADGTPLSKNDSETLDRLFHRSIQYNSPEWYWGDGEPLSAYENSLMPVPLNFPEWVKKDEPRISSPKKNGKRKRAKDEISILADHVRQNVKKEIIWAWGRVKIRMEDKTIQADKIKINNKTGKKFCHATR